MDFDGICGFSAAIAASEAIEEPLAVPCSTPEGRVTKLLFGHHGATIMFSTGSSLILTKTFGNRGNRWKAYAHIPFHEMDMTSIAPFHEMDMTSIAHAILSGYGNTKVGNLQLSLVAKILMCGVPHRDQMDSTTLGCRDHSVPIT